MSSFLGGDEFVNNLMRGANMVCNDLAGSPSGLLMLQEAKALGDPLLVEHQAALRRDLIGKMVGSLYPSILWGEVFELEGLALSLRKQSPEGSE